MGGMTDQFIDRIAELAGQTTRSLDLLAAVIEESGLAAQAATLRSISRLHAKVALDCMVETQPIEISRYNLSERLLRSINEIDDISADLLNRGRPGHSALSEAAMILRQALSSQPE